MLSLGLGDFWGKSQGKGLAASGSLLVVVGVVLSCRAALSLTSSRLHEAPSRLQPPELCPGTARLGKSFHAIMGRPSLEIHNPIRRNSWASDRTRVG